MFNGKTIFIAGHARLPQGMAAKSVFETLTITAEIDVKYGVDTRSILYIGNRAWPGIYWTFIKGISLNDGVDDAIEAIQTYYHGKAANALIAALKDLGLHFQQIKAGRNNVL